MSLILLPYRRQLIRSSHSHPQTRLLIISIRPKWTSSDWNRCRAISAVQLKVGWIEPRKSAFFKRETCSRPMIRSSLKLGESYLLPTPIDCKKGIRKSAWKISIPAKRSLSSLTPALPLSAMRKNTIKLTIRAALLSNICRPI